MIPLLETFSSWRAGTVVRHGVSPDRAHMPCHRALYCHTPLLSRCTREDTDALCTRVKSTVECRGWDRHCLRKAALLNEPLNPRIVNKHCEVNTSLTTMIGKSPAIVGPPTPAAAGPGTAPHAGRSHHAVARLTFAGAVAVVLAVAGCGLGVG